VLLVIGSQIRWSSCLLLRRHQFKPLCLLINFLIPIPAPTSSNGSDWAHGVGWFLIVLAAIQGSRDKTFYSRNRNRYCNCTVTVVVSVSLTVSVSVTVNDSYYSRNLKMAGFLLHWYWPMPGTVNAVKGRHFGSSSICQNPAVRSRVEKMRLPERPILFMQPSMSCIEYLSGHFGKPEKRNQNNPIFGQKVINQRLSKVAQTVTKRPIGSHWFCCTIAAQLKIGFRQPLQPGYHGFAFRL